MQNLIATTFEVVHYIALQAVHYKPLQEVHLSRYNQLRRQLHSFCVGLLSVRFAFTLRQATIFPEEALRSPFCQVHIPASFGVHLPTTSFHQLRGLCRLQGESRPRLPSVQRHHLRRTSNFCDLMLAMQLCWHRKLSPLYSTVWLLQCQHNEQLSREI